MPRYFHKELVSNPIILKNGYAVQWESVGDDEGVIQTAKEDVAAMLKEFETARRGGVREITQEGYEQLKKKPVQDSPRRPSMSEPWIQDVPRLAGLRTEVPVAVGGELPRPAVQPAFSTPANPGPPGAGHIKPPLSVAGIDPTANRPKAVKAETTPVAESTKPPPP
jgi:hypothetical protein